MYTVWSVNDGLSGNPWKPPKTGHGGFRQVFELFISTYRVVCQWWIIQKPTGNLRPRRFPDNPSLTDHTVYVYFFSDFFIDKNLRKPTRNQPRRFPDNPSLTDHTVDKMHHLTAVSFLMHTISQSVFCKKVILFTKYPLVTLFAT